MRQIIKRYPISGQQINYDLMSIFPESYLQTSNFFPGTILDLIERFPKVDPETDRKKICRSVKY